VRSAPGAPVGATAAGPEVAAAPAVATAPAAVTAPLANGGSEASPACEAAAADCPGTGLANAADGGGVDPTPPPGAGVRVGLAVGGAEGVGRGVAIVGLGVETAFRANVAVTETAVAMLTRQVPVPEQPLPA